MKSLLQSIAEKYEPTYSYDDIKHAEQMAIILDPTQEPRVFLFRDFSEAEELFADCVEDGEKILDSVEAVGPNERLIRVELSDKMTVIICDISKY